MVQKARAIRDILTGDWTPIPLFEQIDEVNPNDSDHVTSGVGILGDTFAVKLAPLRLPNLNLSPQKLTVRMRHDSLGGYQCAMIELVENIESLENERIISTSYYQLSSAFLDYEKELTSSEIDKIRCYENLSLRVTAYLCPTSTSTTSSTSTTTGTTSSTSSTSSTSTTTGTTSSTSSTSSTSTTTGTTSSTSSTSSSSTTTESTSSTSSTSSSSTTTGSTSSSSSTSTTTESTSSTSSTSSSSTTTESTSSTSSTSTTTGSTTTVTTFSTTSGTSDNCCGSCSTAETLLVSYRGETGELTKLGEGWIGVVEGCEFSVGCVDGCYSVSAGTVDCVVVIPAISVQCDPLEIRFTIGSCCPVGEVVITEQT